jgi:2-oxoglutarate/2-oxoacid ferredoxin oxidoreductase subunit alpha
MSTTLERGALTSGALTSPIGVNNFSIIAATVNGSGSQTANNAIARACFKMGIPATGKNLFPSNISGLPTWFIIRLSDEGFIARREQAEILIAMNRATAAEDIANVPAGGVVIYPSEWKLTEERQDIIYYSLPVQQLAKESKSSAKLLTYAANMVYVGALVELLGIEIDEIEGALLHHFSGKRKAVDSNMAVVRAAVNYTRENIQKRDPYQVKRADKTAGKVMIDGNSAGALGAVFGGFSVCAWYPITPSTSLVDALSEYANELRIDPETKRHNFAIVQAEDEIAALGMVVGAGWAGARSMTATSGPGISLMTEYAGYAYFTEIPAVIWDVQRMGPSTGLPTRVSQGDLLMVYYLGHGDTKQVILLPSDMKECFEFGWRSFDLAERLQTPVFVLSDLDLGMNTWMSDAFEYPDRPMDRGKVLNAEEVTALKGFSRYSDGNDGDGVGPRTVPGTPSPYAAYFTRGSGHNKDAKYTERPEDWAANMERLRRKHDFARTIVPAPIVDEVDEAEIGIIAYGSSDGAVTEARYRLDKAGIKTSYLRIRALPTTTYVTTFIEKYPRIIVVENNFDGQMAKILQAEMPTAAAKIVSVAKCDGLSLSSEWVASSILEWGKK